MPILDLHTLCPAIILEIIFLRLFLHHLSAIITGRSLFTLPVMGKLALSAAYQNTILFATCPLVKMPFRDHCAKDIVVLCFPPPPEAIKYLNNKVKSLPSSFFFLRAVSSPLSLPPQKLLNQLLNEVICLHRYQYSSLLG